MVKLFNSIQAKISRIFLCLNAWRTCWIILKLVPKTLHCAMQLLNYQYQVRYAIRLAMHFFLTNYTSARFEKLPFCLGASGLDQLGTISYKLFVLLFIFFVFLICHHKAHFQGAFSPSMLKTVNFGAVSGENGYFEWN